VLKLAHEGMLLMANHSVRPCESVALGVKV